MEHRGRRLAALLLAPAGAGLVISLTYLIAHLAIYGDFSSALRSATVIALVSLACAASASSSLAFARIALSAKWEANSGWDYRLYAVGSFLFLALPLVLAATLPRQPDQLFPALILVGPSLVAAGTLGLGRVGRGPGTAIWTGLSHGLRRTFNTATREAAIAEERLREFNGEPGPHDAGAPGSKASRAPSHTLIGIGAAALLSFCVGRWLKARDR